MSINYLITTNRHICFPNETMTKVHPLYVCNITLTAVFPYRSFLFSVYAEGEGCFWWGFTFCTQRCGLNILVLWIIKSFGELFSATRGPKYDCSFQRGDTLNCHSVQNKSREDTGCIFKSRVSHMLNDALAFLFQECILDTASEAYTVGKNAQTCDRKVADSDLWKLLQCCRDWSVLWAQWLRCLPEVPAAEMKHKSVPESVSTQTTEKMLTRLVLVTHSSCSANYCSTHPSENPVSSSKALGVVILC